MEAVETVLGRWEAFYLIVGSAAAALTGLQFVVIALVAETTRRSSPSTLGAFATPTVVHFCGVLLTSSVLAAPWPTLRPVALFMMGAGVTGVAYSVLVAVRARRQGGYSMVVEDWMFHVVLPLVAYAATIGAGVAMGSRPVVALFFTGGLQLVLLFIGIHNAWDTATYVTLQHLSDRSANAASRAEATADEETTRTSAATVRS
jgi:hypothetical protein